VIERGELNDSGRWLCRSRTVFIAKKTGEAPRPIKVGEVLRAAAAKRLLNRSAGKLRKVFLQMHQWGISIPGGAEALTHWRDLAESASKCGVGKAVVIADLDMANFFNSVEWPAIRDSVARHFPEASPILQWEHARPSESVLSDMSTFSTNRGSEQGETLGSTKAALPLGDVRRLVAADAEHGSGVFDAWYVDDGVVACEPHLFDRWLRRLDQASVSPAAAVPTSRV
jgi:hypothetical protein